MKRGVQVDAVSVSDREHAPQTISELVSEAGIEIGRRVAKAGAHHDVFIKRPDIGREALGELDGSPRAATGSDVGGVETRADFEGAAGERGEGGRHGGIFRETAGGVQPGASLDVTEGLVNRFYCL